MTKTLTGYGVVFGDSPALTLFGRTAGTVMGAWRQIGGGTRLPVDATIVPMTVTVKWSRPKKRPGRDRGDA